VRDLQAVSDLVIKKYLSIQQYALKVFVFDYLFGLLSARLDPGYCLLLHFATVQRW
jgi:hypothetical protein